MNKIIQDPDNRTTILSVSVTQLAERVKTVHSVANADAYAVAARRGVREHADYENKVAIHHTVDSISLQSTLRYVIYFAAICAVLLIRFVAKQ